MPRPDPGVHRAPALVSVCLVLCFSASCAGSGSGSGSPRSGKPRGPSEPPAREARFKLKRMFDGAKVFLERPFAEARGASVATESLAFPPSVPLTPATPCCTHPSGSCPANALHFTTPGWKNLFFAPDEAHHCQYQFLSEGRGKTARFIVRAVCPERCGGPLRVYERSGWIGEPIAVVGSARVRAYTVRSVADLRNDVPLDPR